MKYKTTLFLLLIALTGLAQTTISTPSKFLNGLLLPNASTSPMIGAGSLWYNPSTNKISFYNVATSSWQYVLSETLAAATYPTLTGAGASGNWNINVLGNANTASVVPWSGITSKPTTITGYGLTDAVPFGRTLTINGVTYDLSTNRSWVITESDPTVPSFVKSITSTNITNWSSAYGWGNHAGLYMTLTGDQNISGYKRFLGSMGVGNNIYMGGSPIDSFAGSGVQMNNTDDAATTTAGWKIGLGTLSDMIFYMFSGPPGAINPVESFRIVNATGVLRYAFAHTFTNDLDIINKKYVDDKFSASAGVYVKGTVNSESDVSVPYIDVYFGTAMANTSYTFSITPLTNQMGSSHWYVTAKTTTYFRIYFGTPIVANLVAFDYTIYP